MDSKQRRFFRDDLREARAAALADAEGYSRPLHSLERLGRFLNPSVRSLGGAASHLSELAEDSPFGRELADEWPQFHSHFSALIETTRDARNDAVHVGAKARHLNRHLTEICLVLEDALQQGLSTVADFMVSPVVWAERWQPVSLIRQWMLENSFTFIPVKPDEDGGDWVFVADRQLALYLGDRGRVRGDRLRKRLDAVLGEDLECFEARYIEANTGIGMARKRLGDQPLLVQSERHVVGIITAFDML